MADPAPDPARRYEDAVRLGLALAAQGRREEAVAAFREAVAIRPDSAAAHYNLGFTLQNCERAEEAAAEYRTALSLQPDYFPAANNLGLILHAAGRFAEAETLWRRFLTARADLPEAHFHLGNALRDSDRLDHAIESYRRALALRPDSVNVLINMGHALERRGDLDEAIAAFERAIQLHPKSAEAHNGLGNAMKDAGRLDEALASYRRAEEIGGGSWAGSNLLYAMHFHPDSDPRALFEAHDRWNRNYALPLQPISRLRESPLVNRPLRVGFVSPDFREHPVGRFLLPLFREHDSTGFEIVCYSDVRRPDDLTRRLQSFAHSWRETAALSDERLAEIIRDDRIDVLVDLTMHMEGNRLLMFARRPAPVQVTWLAYCGTTGLTAMDWRLSDDRLDPPGGDESVYSERTMRLPRTWWCYEPPIAGEIAPPPAMTAGRVTFGCLNNFCKVTAPTLDCWADILRGVPGSRLIVQSPRGAHRDRVLARFADAGIAVDRIEFVDRVPKERYFRMYDRIDLALDPFPWGGGTTTCDAMWMGVPTVTLAGRTAVSRGGESLLSTVGLTRFVASSPIDYVRIATKAAEDSGSLASLRAGLRERMLASPLMDAPGFARDMERLFRDLFARRQP